MARKPCDALLKASPDSMPRCIAWIPRCAFERCACSRIGVLAMRVSLGRWWLLGAPVATRCRSLAGG
eukprot:2094424-Pyramimonas_sp.AAC.1